jgi:hypothetical protein
VSRAIESDPPRLVLVPSNSCWERHSPDLAHVQGTARTSYDTLICVPGHLICTVVDGSIRLRFREPVDRPPDASDDDEWRRNLILGERTE